MNAYKDFQVRFKLLIEKNPSIVYTTLSNIFTMRLVGNKTHGDLAEIGIVEFINQFMYDFKSIHVGKDLYRAKTNEEDIVVINELTKIEFPLSLKAYGHGPLQLSTDKHSQMFPFLESKITSETTNKRDIQSIFTSTAFQDFGKIHIMPLIYNEKEKQCNIMVFDHDLAKANTQKIKKVSSGRGRKHPVFLFLDEDENYIFEVRYGSATANALQRGLWTHTKKAFSYFESLTQGWVSYHDNPTLVRMLGLALVSTQAGHQEAIGVLEKDVQKQKLKKQ